MPDGSIELKGGKELHDQLLQLPDRIATNVMAGAMYAGAKIIRDLARKRVPILNLERWGGPHEPGLLLQSVQASRTRSRDRNFVGAIVGIAKSAFYGRFIEFGTKHAAAFPFMRPAADEGKEDAASAVIEYAGRRIEQEAARQQP